MTIFNIGDYFLNNDRHLCKIINSSQDYSGKLLFHVHIIDTNHLPIIYASDLKRHVFKHLGNNEEVAQTLYRLNDEEIARRDKYERQLRKMYDIGRLYGANYALSKLYSTTKSDSSADHKNTFAKFFDYWKTNKSGGD